MDRNKRRWDANGLTLSRAIHHAAPPLSFDAIYFDQHNVSSSRDESRVAWPVSHSFIPEASC